MNESFKCTEFTTNPWNSVKNIVKMPRLEYSIILKNGLFLTMFCDLFVTTFAIFAIWSQKSI